MAPGARIIKTGIAVAITMYICRWLELEPAVFGAVSAVINVQPSMYLTYRTAWNQLAIHVLGVGIAFALGFSLGGSPLTMGLATVIIIWLYRRLRLQQGILMGIVAAVFVMGSSPDQFIGHALERTGVIFTGLIVATIVNFLLFRPHYKERLAHTLCDYNSAAVSFFNSAVAAFVSLDKTAPDDLEEKLGHLAGLLEECRTLASFCAHEEFKEAPDPFEPGDDWLKKSSEFIEYNRGLVDRAREIYEILPVRHRRRMKLGEPPLSEEFRVILDMLSGSVMTIERVNKKLCSAVCLHTPVEAEPISEDFWEQLSKAVDEWQFKVTGSYYLHALLEISVVAANIRWAARRAKEIQLKKNNTDSMQNMHKIRKKVTM